MKRENTYDRQTGKLIARIAENLPEMSRNVMQELIQNPLGLQKFLRDLVPPRAETFTVWETIEIGLHRSFASYRLALKERGVWIISPSGGGDEEIRKMVGSFSIAPEKTEVEIVTLRVGELRFPRNRVSYPDILKRAEEEVGLRRCSLETAFALRLAYMHQQSGELLFIATDPLGDDGVRVIPALYNKKEMPGDAPDKPLSLKLDFRNGAEPADQYTNDRIFAFALPEKSR